MIKKSWHVGISASDNDPKHGYDGTTPKIRYLRFCRCEKCKHKTNGMFKTNTRIGVHDTTNIEKVHRFPRTNEKQARK